MNLIEILGKNGVGSVEGITKLNYTLVQIVGLMKNMEQRSKSDGLQANFFIDKEDVGKYPIVINNVEYVEDKEQGLILGKIYPTQDDWKNWVDVRFDIRDDEVKFQAELGKEKQG